MTMNLIVRRPYVALATCTSVCEWMVQVQPTASCLRMLEHREHERASLRIAEEQQHSRESGVPHAAPPEDALINDGETPCWSMRRRATERGQEGAKSPALATPDHALPRCGDIAADRIGGRVNARNNVPSPSRSFRLRINVSDDRETHVKRVRDRMYRFNICSQASRSDDNKRRVYTD